MSGRGYSCWQCGRPAPGGVCLGPHVGYDHSAAVSAQMVMNLDRPERALTYIGASIDYETLPRRREWKRRYAAQARLDARIRRERDLAARIAGRFAA